MKDRPVPDVVVDRAHRHDRAQPASNVELGLRRANAIRSLLVDAGLDASVIEVTSHGEADLLVQDGRRGRRTAQPPRRNHGQMTSAAAPARPAVRPGARRSSSRCSRSTVRRSCANLEYGDLRRARARRAAAAAERPHRDRRRRRAQPVRDRPVAVAPRRHRQADRAHARSRRVDRSRSTSSSRNRIGTKGSGVATDEALAETLRGGGVVLGYALTFDRARRNQSSACVQHPLGLAIIRRGDDPADDPFFRATGAVCSLPVLTQAAGASGFLNAAPDPDGLLRRVPLLHGARRPRSIPGLALAAVIAATGTRDISLRVANVNAASLLLDGRSVPLDGKSNLLLRYRGAKRTFPYVSAADVLSGRTPRRHVQGQDRVRRHDGARHARGGGDAARYAVCRRRGAGDGGRQPAAAGLHPPARVRASWSKRRSSLGLGIVAALLVGRFGLAWGGRRGRRRPGGGVGRRRAVCWRPAASSCRRSFRRSA